MKDGIGVADIKPDISAEQIDAYRKFMRVQYIGDSVKKFIGALPWIAASFFLFMSIDSLAGKNTNANISVFARMMVNLSIDRWAAYAIGITGISYGIGENTYRKRKVAYLGNRVRELEKIIDPKRSTSKLNSHGGTREGD